MNERLNGWTRFIPLGVVVASGLVAFGVLRSDTAALRRDVDQKANRETVDAHYSEILRRLDAVDRHLERIEAKP